MKKKVYCLGNSLLSSDHLPLLLLPVLSKRFPYLSFVHHDPTEEFTDVKDGQLILIDTVKGIKKVTVFVNLDKFSRTKSASVHDFDLSVQLGLMEKLGKIKKLIIIGVPMRGEKKGVLKEIITIIKSISPSENARHSSYRGQTL